jgi:hypothetical protein
MATPISTQAATNHPRLGARATATTASTPSTEPAVITIRGPSRSSRRPTQRPAPAATTCAMVKTAMRWVSGQPSRSRIDVARTMNA